MRRLSTVCIVLFLLTGVMALVPVTMAGSSAVTANTLAARFKALTKDTLVVNRKAGFAGHYVALDYGVPSITKRARYGTFTIYVVTGPDVEAEVTDLLADDHTGQLGTPGRGNIYWEAGTTLRGDHYWLAKRRYGANVVLWWIGSTPVQKTDATFQRLHKALTKAVAS